MAVEKLYESDSYIVVNKPYDMYINSDDPNEKNTVANHIARHDSHLSSSPQPLHFVQRLDYSTSGVLCLAKTKRAAADACRLFEKRAAKKYYVAVLRGHADFKMADVLFAVGSDTSPDNTHKMVAVTSASSASSESGRPRTARTRVLALATGDLHGDPVTYVLMKPVTGRRHQLRVHCQAIGHPIMGDYTYSDRADTKPHRMFLHAYRLVLPIQQEPLDVSCHTDPELSLDWLQSSPYSYETACEMLDQDSCTDVRVYACS